MKTMCFKVCKGSSKKQHDWAASSVGLWENMGDPRFIAGWGCMENPKIKWMISRGTMGYPYIRKLPDVDAIWCNANIHRLRYIDLREWQRQKPAVFLHVCWIYLCWRCWRPRNATNLGTSRTFNLEIPLGRSGLNGNEERSDPHIRKFLVNGCSKMIGCSGPWVLIL